MTRHKTRPQPKPPKPPVNHNDKIEDRHKTPWTKINETYNKTTRSKTEDPPLPRWPSPGPPQHTTLCLPAADLPLFLFPPLRRPRHQ